MRAIDDPVYQQRLTQARARFSRVGYTIPQFAKELDVHPAVVRRVLQGKLFGNWGDAHKVCVALGLKDGVIAKPGESLEDLLRRAG